MFCTNCGYKLASNDVYCPNCGKQKYQEVTKKTEENYPMIFGVLGFIFSFLFIFLGIIFCLMSLLWRNQTKKNGFAIAGLVICVLRILAIIILFISILSAFTVNPSSSNKYSTTTASKSYYRSTI